jgi:hypothetical protein
MRGKFVEYEGMAGLRCLVCNRALRPKQLVWEFEHGSTAVTRRNVYLHGQCAVKLGEMTIMDAEAARAEVLETYGDKFDERVLEEAGTV